MISAIAGNSDFSFPNPEDELSVGNLEPLFRRVWTELLWLRIGTCGGVL
jgi:hypothetical protein